MQIVELEMVPLSLRPVLQRLYDMKTTQSALREGVLFSTKRNNYYYDTGTGKVIVLDDDTSYIFRVLFDPTLSAETPKGVEWGNRTLTRTMAKNCNCPVPF